MDENIETVVDEATETVTDTENETPETETETKADGADNEAVTFTDEEVSKKVQSECDKLRSKYSAEIKDLKGQIKKLSPVEKSESEIEIENRLAELEKAQNEVNDQKQFLVLQDTLQGKGIDKSIATYLKNDVDVDEFSTLFTKIIKDSVKSNGYVPDEHTSGDKVTVEEFKSMKYSEKEKIAKNSPELYKRLMAKLKR